MLFVAVNTIKNNQKARERKKLIEDVVLFCNPALSQMSGVFPR